VAPVGLVEEVEQVVFLPASVFRACPVLLAPVGQVVLLVVQVVVVVVQVVLPALVVQVVLVVQLVFFPASVLMAWLAL
jgi:hypothetical protein